MAAVVAGESQSSFGSVPLVSTPAKHFLPGRVAPSDLLLDLDALEQRAEVARAESLIALAESAR